MEKALQDRLVVVVKVSVIVPIYNTEKYIGKCLDSILNQTFQDFEIIIISDGPNEDHKIADEYAQKDNRITVIKNIKKGLGGARNAALNIAKGEYISFVDSDDWIESETYKRALTCFSDDIDLVIFGVNIVGDSSLITQGLCDYFKLKYIDKQLINEDTIFNTNVSAWNKIYKKSIIDKYNLRFSENMQYEDFPFYFQYSLVSNNAYYLNEPLYNYLQRSDSGMAKTSAHNFNYIKDHILGCKFLYDELNKKGLYERNKQLFSEVFARWIRIGLGYCRRKDKVKYLSLAYEIYNQMSLWDNATLKYLKSKNFEYIIKGITKEQKAYLFGVIPVLTVRYFLTDKIKIYLFGIMIVKISLKRGR